MTVTREKSIRAFCLASHIPSPSLYPGGKGGPSFQRSHALGRNVTKHCATGQMALSPGRFLAYLDIFFQIMLGVTATKEKRL